MRTNPDFLTTTANTSQLLNDIRLLGSFCLIICWSRSHIARLMNMTSSDYRIHLSTADAASIANNVDSTESSTNRRDVSLSGTCIGWHCLRALPRNPISKSRFFPQKAFGKYYPSCAMINGVCLSASLVWGSGHVASILSGPDNITEIAR